MKINQGHILEYILKNEKAARSTIRLVASENLPQVESRLPFVLDMFARYSFLEENLPWEFPTYYLKEIEERTQNLLKEFLQVNHVNLKAISGLNCMLTAIASYNNFGDTVMSIDPIDGGHLETRNVVNKLGLKSKYLPFNRETWTIDIERLKSENMLADVSTVYLDLCMVAFPQPLQELKQVLNKKTILIYDASHVLGLILGDQFQQPLHEGADILIGNTHKTVPGPHKAIFASNKRLLNWQFTNTSYHFISHHHIAENACLGLILEQGKDYFVDYASRTIENAKYLAAELYKNGVNVQLKSMGFTNSHQIWIECGEKDNVSRIVNTLSRINIVVNGALIPSINGQFGLRIGVQEITQRRISKRGIQLLAEIIGGIIRNDIDMKQIENTRMEIINHSFEQNSDYDKVDKIINILVN